MSMGACAASVASVLPCQGSSSVGEIEIVPPESRAGRVPGVAVSLEALAVTGKTGSPSPVLEAVLAGRKMDLDRAQAIAQDIGKPEYSLAQYYQDLLTTFPELHLFSLEGLSVEATDDSPEGLTTGGRAAGDEFQRTMGAFFAIYWLFRLPLDGKHGFCRGVDESWKPVESREGESEKVAAFFEDEEIWKHFQDLMLDAGLMVKQGGAMRVDKESTLALLVLTALHDIMKINALLPTVQKADAPYRGYLEAEVIADHDLAVFYIMEQHTHILPSLCQLPPAMQQVVQTVLSGLAFNNGWFVQAEAPPGAVFLGIKAAIMRNGSERRVSRRDLSLYFVHWLTDLAGAEPTPLCGCNKLTSQLPMPVLKSFMKSVRYIQQLADRSETEVMESYLKDRWKDHRPSMGTLAGPHALAKARLLCMAQGNAKVVLDAFEKLSPEDQEVLSVEMARTGAERQSFSKGFVPDSVRQELVGPAFLVYYGPAFLQRMGSDSPLRRLEILAEIYRCARKLWPARTDQAGDCVTVRIDAITIQGQWSSADPEVLLLRMCSSKQACLERRPEDAKKNREDNAVILFDSEPPTFLPQAPELCSQEELIRRISHEMLTNGQWYRKVAFAFLRPAKPGEVITTMVNGKEETRNIAQESDFVVQANTKWKENYILSKTRASEAYDLTNPMEIPSGRPDASQLSAEGFRCYRSRTRIKALKATDELLRRYCPFKRFMAKWGTPCVVQVDDMLAAQVAGDTVTEIYRIEKTVFRETFVPDVASEK
eukprot:s15_g24.t1